MMNYSQITKDLLIGTTPLASDYETLRNLGVQLVINMRIERRPFADSHNPPMPVLWLPTFDSPFIHIPVHVLRKGAIASLEVIQQGGKVYAHCAEGKHRGVAMGAAILIALGYPAEEAMRQIKQKRSNASPYTWYIKKQILRFANSWKE